jgi:hypothetical protein
LPKSFSETTADLEPEQRKYGADKTDDYRCQCETHVEGAEGEADDEIIDAERGTEQDEPFEAQFGVPRWCLSSYQFRQNGIDTGQTENAAG